MMSGHTTLYSIKTGPLTVQDFPSLDIQEWKAIEILFDIQEANK